MHILYFLVLFIFSVYSYVLVDPNFTLFNHPVWEVFRNYMVQIGYYNRPLSGALYVIFIGLLCFFAWYFYKHYKRYNPVTIAFLVVAAVFISYPFLSHDYFNYMFDAKIFAFYHQNPYLKKALDFPVDPWIRFMHWTHRTYPYGPTFLVLSIIPSFFSFGKLIISYFLFKVFFGGFYVAMIYFVAKINKQKAMFLATSPLIIVEGLISSHNDIVATSLTIIGLYFLLKDTPVWGRGLLVLSAGIKYFTAPFLIIGKQENIISRLVLGICIALLVVLATMYEVQPWYFLLLFAFIFHYPSFLKNISILFISLLLSYYPYMLGGWNTAGVAEKHLIILVGCALNLVYLAYLYQRKKSLFV